jgi:hypothetical protein
MEGSHTSIGCFFFLSWGGIEASPLLLRSIWPNVPAPKDDG